jgi:hypothetical protein
MSSLSLVILLISLLLVSSLRLPYNKIQCSHSSSNLISSCSKSSSNSKLYSVNPYNDRENAINNVNNLINLSSKVLLSSSLLLSSKGL